MLIAHHPDQTQYQISNPIHPKSNNEKSVKIKFETLNRIRHKTLQRETNPTAPGCHHFARHPLHFSLDIQMKTK